LRISFARRSSTTSLRGCLISSRSLLVARSSRRPGQPRPGAHACGGSPAAARCHAPHERSAGQTSTPAAHRVGAGEKPLRRLRFDPSGMGRRHPGWSRSCSPSRAPWRLRMPPPTPARP
jgi:hypothetical protein